MDNIEVPTLVGSKKHKELSLDVYSESITVVKNDNAFPMHDKEQVLVVCPDNGTTMQVEDKKYANISLGEIVEKYHENTEIEQLSSIISDEKIAHISKKAKQYDAIVVGTLNVLPGSKQFTLVDELSKTAKKIIVIAMRSPYDIAYLPNVAAYLNTYEFTYPALKVAAGAIFGKWNVSGKLPVNVG